MGIAALNPPFPRAGLYAIGGSQVYGYDSLGNWPNTISNSLARYTLVIIGGNYDAWGRSTRLRSNLVNSIKTGTGNGRPPASQASVVLQYELIGQTDQTSPLNGGGSLPTPNSNDVKPEYSQNIGKNNWWGYPVGSGGSLPTDSFGGSMVLYTVNPATGAWYGGLDPSFGDGPYEMGAKMVYYKYLSTNRTGDSRFSGLSLFNVAPQLDGMFWDNMLRNLQNSNEPQIDWNRSGSTGNQSGYDGAEADAISAGEYKKHAMYQSLLGGTGASGGSGAQKFNFGNFGDYAFSTNTGVAPYDMNQVMHGCLMESWFGFGSSPDTFTNAAGLITTAQTMHGRLQAPKFMMMGCRWPKTLPTVKFGKFPNASGAVGSLSFYQFGRYSTAFCALWDGLSSWQDQNIEYGQAEAQSTLDAVWLDEYDAGGTASGWLGHPVAGATGAVGGYIVGNGVYGREFTGGFVLWNPQGNNLTSVTPAMLPGGSGVFRRINGSQVPSVNNGALVTSNINLGNTDGSGSERDAIYLVRA